MIFVSVGTQKFQMNRLLRMVDQIAEQQDFEEDIIIQSGNCTYNPKNAKVKAFIPKDEYEKNIHECSLLITHAGVGTIMQAVSMGKPVIVVPREAQYGEHIDDHQKQISNAFSHAGYVHVAHDIIELTKLISEYKSWEIKPYVSNTDNFVRLVKELLGLEKRNNKILFYSPLHAKVKNTAVGGAESGCKRTVEILDKLEIPVVHVTKPTIANGMLGYAKECFSCLKEYRKIIKDKDISLVYLIGFYEKNIYLEYLLSRMAKKKKKHLIYEPKNGNLVSEYKSRGKIYRFFMKQTLKAADAVLCQGQKYSRFLKKELGINGIDIPNYVMDRYLEMDICHEKDPVKTEAGYFRPIELFFFGRVEQDKGIEIQMEISRILAERNIRNRLTIIGACSPEYRKKLNKCVKTNTTANNHIQFLDRMPFDSLVQQFEKMDFYLFPSSNKKEGHSNSVTEAMAFGIVPIASTVGFNCDVIGNQDLIVESLDAEHYADRIQNILEEGKLSYYRSFARNRIKENYTESIIQERLKKVLNKLI